MRFIITLGWFLLLVPIALLAEGTKQLKPDSTKNCDIIFQPADLWYPVQVWNPVIPCTSCMSVSGVQVKKFTLD